MNMKKILLFTLCIFSVNAFAQHTSTGTNLDWNNAAAWDQNSIPGSSDNVIINHAITVSVSNAVCNNLRVNHNSGAGSLTISGNDAKVDAGGTGKVYGVVTVTGGSATNPATLDIAGELTLSGSITVNAGQRFILGSSGSPSDIEATGPLHINSASNSHGSFYNYGTWNSNGPNGIINYSRFIANLSSWDLIGVPVSNLSMSTFVSGNTDIASGGGSGNNQYAIGVYSNTTATYNSGSGSGANTWLNYTTTTVGSAGNFEPGRGYQMASSGSAANEGKEVTFSGTPNTGSVTEPVINSETGGSGDNDPSNGTKFNLVSNPYPSFISVTSFISGNSNVLHAGVHQAVYGWDGSNYDTYNNSTGGFIAPAQGFMVGAQSASSTNLSFTTSMQSTSNSSMDDFISGDVMDDDRAELFIGYNSNEGSDRTRIYFLDNVSDGLDVGYDAAKIDFDNDFISTRLVDSGDDEGYSVTIQALSYTEMWDKIVPLSINSAQGQEFMLSITHNTTPADLNIYLEDVLEGTMTDLKAGDFSLIPSVDLDGVGRFFIHTTADTMSNSEISTSMLNAYKEVNANYITLEGLATQSDNINVSLFNILGRKVLETSLNNNVNTQTISTLGMASGIYVIELESGDNRLTKKFIIQ